jgi:cation diffusion facilitator CzcD-associated flavoprotein CzcO
MLLNQSKHTVHFSDLAWDDDAPQLPQAWMVGKYLQRYVQKYLEGNDGFKLSLGTRVMSAVPLGTGDEGWKVVVQSESGDDERHFDLVVVASGFFGKPIIPAGLQAPSNVPVIHSSKYRDLKRLLGKGAPGGGKILIVGGQMSGVEIAGTIGAHLSAAINAPDASEIGHIDQYAIHHVIQRPIWVFPLLTSPMVSLVIAVRW